MMYLAIMSKYEIPEDIVQVIIMQKNGKLILFLPSWSWDSSENVKRPTYSAWCKHSDQQANDMSSEWSEKVLSTTLVIP